MASTFRDPGLEVAPGYVINAITASTAATWSCTFADLGNLGMIG